MSNRLNSSGKSFARKLINSGDVDKSSAWSFSAADGNKILGDNDWSLYGKHHLGFKPEADKKTKERFSFPFAKIKNGKSTVYRSALVAIRQRAGQTDDTSIFDAAGELLNMIDNERNEVVEIREIEPITRSVSIKPNTYDENNRTVEIIFSTGARVKRGFFDEFYEELSLDPGHVRLGRLNSGAPFLNSHSSRNLDDVIGVVESASVDGKEGVATIRFSNRDGVQDIVNDVKDGIIRNISVGYRIHRMELVEKSDNEIPVYRATDWEPIEISAVPAGADDGAKFRSADVETNMCQIEVRTMEDVNDKAAENVQPESTVETKEEPTTNEVREVKPDAEREEMEKEKELKIRKEAIKAEKERQKQIKFAVRAAGLGDEFAEELIDSEKSIDEVRCEVINKLAEKDKQTETRNAVVETHEVDSKELRSEGMSEAILHRLGRNNGELSENARRYAYMSMLELAKRSLESQGEKLSGLRPMEIARRAFQATSDFPEILANTAYKTLRQAYDAAPQTFAPFTRPVTVRDFKEVSRVQFGDAPNLELVPENSAFQRGSIGEAAEKYSIATYGKIVAYSRQALINDDLSAFDRTSELMGRAARDTESDLVWNAVIANAAMADGHALFSAAHGNFSNAAASPSITTMTAVRAAMRLQVGLGGRLLNLSPSYIWVPAALETAAEQLVTAVQPNDQSKTNPFASGGRTPLQIIVEPRLDADSTAHWYASALLSAIDMFEIARLEGEAGPMVESRVGFDVDGMEIKIRHDVGVKAIDHRGLYKYGV